MDNGPTLRGRCLCARTTFEVEAGGVLWRAICHCESCRRATSAPMVAWFGVRDGAWRWTGDKPARFVSSPGAERGFCRSCGSPMFFRSDRWPGETHFYAASLDHPEDYAPSVHVNWSEALPWVHPDDGLPRVATTAG